MLSREANYSFLCRYRFVAGQKKGTSRHVVNNVDDGVGEGAGAGVGMRLFLDGPTYKTLELEPNT